MEVLLYMQAIAGAQEKYDLAAALEIEPSKIHFHIPYVGGGFSELRLVQQFIM